MSASNWKLSELLEGVIDNAADYSDITINHITLDSREVGEGSLFVAVSGSAKHGLNFADKAIDKGAAAILWETDESWSQGEYAIPVIAIDDLRERLGIIIDRYYGSPSADMKIVGITGTDGKTTVSHFVAEALNAIGERSAVIGTLGVGVPGSLVETGLTTPDVIAVHRTLAEFKQQGVQNVIMEVSSHALDQHRVAGVRFDVAALTNLGRDHLDYHETVAAYGDAKAKLFEWDSLTTVVLNHDDKFGKELAQKINNKATDVNHSTEGSTEAKTSLELINYCVAYSNDVSAECLTAVNPKYSASGIQADFYYKGEAGEHKAMSAPVLGEFNTYNLLAATGCLMGLGKTFAEAVACIEHVKTVPGRMEKVSTKEDRSLVVVDFAHTPGALEAALKAIREHTPSRLVCVMGCGGDRDRGKRPMMAKVAEQYADMVVLTDDNPRSEMPFQIMHDMIEGLENPEYVAMEHDRAKAIKFAVDSVEQGDSVLIAGKGHEKYQIVGDEKRPFDDREQARVALDQMRQELADALANAEKGDYNG